MTREKGEGRRIVSVNIDVGGEEFIFDENVSVSGC